MKSLENLIAQADADFLSELSVGLRENFDEVVQECIRVATLIATARKLEKITRRDGLEDQCTTLSVETFAGRMGFTADQIDAARRMSDVLDLKGYSSTDLNGLDDFGTQIIEVCTGELDRRRMFTIETPARREDAPVH